MGCASAASAQYIMDKKLGPAADQEIVDKRGSDLPLDLAFTSAEGKSVTLRDAFGPKGQEKPVVIAMVYFRCPILCPKVMQELVKGLTSVAFTPGRDYNVLIVSFDHRDVASDALDAKETMLASFAAYAGAGKPVTQRVRDNWNVWIGPPENCKELADALGFPYKFLPKAGEFSHPSVLFIASPGGTVSTYLEGLTWEERDLRVGIVKAGEGQVGSLLDRVAAWCYHFDPDEGSFSVQAMRVMQIGSVGGALLLGGLLGSMWAYERRRRRARAGATENGLSQAAEIVNIPKGFEGGVVR
jgi:protein SCO1